ncbi:MAG: HTH domain-containing protein [Saprospiraceae bacterium]
MIERMDQLLRMKSTGTSEELANRLGISRSTLYEMLETMGNMGAEIEYNAHRKTYYYTTEKVLAIGFVEKEKIKGGKKISKMVVVRIFRTGRTYICSRSVSKGRFLNPPLSSDRDGVEKRGEKNLFIKI